MLFIYLSSFPTPISFHLPPPPCFLLYSLFNYSLLPTLFFFFFIFLISLFSFNYLCVLTRFRVFSLLPFFFIHILLYLVSCFPFTPLLLYLLLFSSPFVYRLKYHSRHLQPVFSSFCSLLHYRVLLSLCSLRLSPLNVRFFTLLRFPWRKSLRSMDSHFTIFHTYSPLLFFPSPFPFFSFIPLFIIVFTI